MTSPLSPLPQVYPSSCVSYLTNDTIEPSSLPRVTFALSPFNSFPACRPVLVNLSLILLTTAFRTLCDLTLSSPLLPPCSPFDHSALSLLTSLLAVPWTRPDTALPRVLPRTLFGGVFPIFFTSLLQCPCPIFPFKNIYYFQLFIWLCWSFSCGMQDLPSCQGFSTWDLVPLTRIQPRAPALGA